VRTRADRRTPTRAEELVTDRQDTTPGMDPVRPQGRPGYATGPVHEPGHPGPGYAGPGYAGGATTATTPDYSPRPVAVRRADILAGLLLLLAGAAAAVSLLLPWLAGSDDTGMDLVRRGFDDLGTGVGELVDTGFWQPPAVVLGGGVLLLLGLLAFVPARRHRFLGLLALLVTAAVAAAVLVPLFQAGWDVGAFALGFWFACAVAVLGLLGGLKALLTGRKYRRDPAAI
jgi:hypothetical protein